MTVSPSTKQREAGSLQPARRRIGRRLSAAHVLISVVVILAFVLNLLVLQDRDATTLVAVADQRLVAGTPIEPSSLRLVPVDSGFEALPNLVTDQDLAGFHDWVLSRSIPEGGLIDRTALVEPGEGASLRSMSLPVPAEHAAGGALVEGDRVDVISVIEGEARFVAVDLEVVAVSDRASGAIGSISEFHVVVGVTAEQALDLARALDAGSIEVVRSTGADAITGGSGGGP